MTTAHRPTFDPARGKEAQRGPAYHQRLQPAHTQLKYRRPGQGGAAGGQPRDLRAELLAAESAYAAKTRGESSDLSSARPGVKHAIEAGEGEPSSNSEGATDEQQTKRRKILEETRDIDADDSEEDSDESDEESEDEDETADLMRELNKIKEERAAAKAKEEAEKEAKEQESREEEIAYGNPLLNPKAFNVNRRWDDDVVFKNQARGTEQKTNKEFVNDLLRSDFHKKFMAKYVR